MLISLLQVTVAYRFLNKQFKFPQIASRAAAAAAEAAARLQRHQQLLLQRYTAFQADFPQQRVEIDSLIAQMQECMQLLNQQPVQTQLEAPSASPAAQAAASSPQAAGQQQQMQDTQPAQGESNMSQQQQQAQAAQDAAAATAPGVEEQEWEDVPAAPAAAAAAAANDVGGGYVLLYGFDLVVLFGYFGSASLGCLGGGGGGKGVSAC